MPGDLNKKTTEFVCVKYFMKMCKEIAKFDLIKWSYNKRKTKRYYLNKTEEKMRTTMNTRTVPLCFRVRNFFSWKSGSCYGTLLSEENSIGAAGKTG